MKTHLMEGKTVVITGATAGIGRVTAKELADMGATVVFVARNKEKSEATRRWIATETGNVNVAYVLGDLSRRSEVQSVAQQIASTCPRVDVLINNAGAFFARRQESADGIEMTFALNHLAPFVLTNLLLDTLKRSSPSRIVTVSSGAHQGAHVDFQDLEGRKRYGGWKAYGQSKLCNLLFTYELDRRLSGTGVTANALHPGFVATDFGKNNGGFMKGAMSVVQRIGAISPEKGAETSVYLASSEEVEGVSGRYFAKKRPAPSSAASHDQNAMQRLWEISELMTKLRMAA